MSQFAEKTALISGGAEGIGLSIAKALGEEKMNIVLADIDEDSVKKAAEQLASAGVPVLALALDVAKENEWQEVAKQAIARFGKIHMLVNNAGVGGSTGPVDKQEALDWQWVLDVNLMGVVYGAKAIAPLIKQHGEGGWIVNVASMAGMGGVPFGGAYSATKTAVVALSEGWATELKSAGIHVSVLCPAFVQTRIHQSHRNRPERYKANSVSTGDENSFAKKAQQMVENGIAVSIVGKRLVEALNDNELYVFTHPNYRPVIQHRSTAIDEAFERAARSPLLQDIVNQKIEML